ncbi:hypothetical protein G6F46_009320 [Rhizopus delemar]|uniref:SH3 domain-containing protein n=2 Tax=Rhizopus TaxID=4842 RepID=A0A9P7CLY6_9FUNG|nr:hypothetical protein G6F43_006127 [Rhizopus delemar]KAG1540549.1 hypothetical protein G6F51_008454 [Rhizopus arrhizus]KAG1453453.1 hypothetical protein G6F55_008134 [Rhizopus delemar]KAG1493274.1 hypothetical protein G6F54_008693 [Rhizopus delemar]KAG1507402.1 hypothetical protein G6F53_008976 [Rhizopus delemar]
MITQIVWIFQFGIQQQAFTSELSDYNHSRIFVASPYRNDRNIITYRNNVQEYPLSIQTSLTNQAVHSSTTDNQHTVYLSPHVNYAIPVTAVHNYEGNKTDPNELSFSKGETMYVYEKRGYWWQAKKSNGEIGVIPSNYVRLQ